MPIKEVITSQRVSVKIWTDEVDDKSRAQLSNIASLPFIHHHVAAMPDAHVSIGETVKFKSRLRQYMTVGKYCTSFDAQLQRLQGSRAGYQS
jgi:hypothetical protein